MITMTCPDHTCGYNGFGVCQMHIPVEALRNGRVTQHKCPYYRAAHVYANQQSAAPPQPPLQGPTPTPGSGLVPGGLAQPGQWYPKPADNDSEPFGR